MVKRPLDTNTHISRLLQGGGGNPVESYRHLLERQTPSEYTGQQFIDNAANIPILNDAQLQSANMMQGFGTGIQMPSRISKEEELAQLTNDARDLAAMDMQLKTQLGEVETRKAAFANFTGKNWLDVKKVNDMLSVGDYKGLNELMPRLMRAFEQTTPEIAAEIGKFNHIFGDNVYIETPEGEVRGYNIKEFFEPIIDALPPEMQQELPNLMSYTTQQKFEKSDIFENLATAEQRAKIEAINASSAESLAKIPLYSAQEKQTRAHANLYNAEAEAKINEIPTKYEESLQKEIYKSNNEWFIKTKEETARLEKQAEIYNNLANLISRSNRAGTGLYKQLLRTIDQSRNVDSYIQAKVIFEQQGLLPEFKEIFKGTQSDLDLKTFMQGIPALTQDPIAAIETAQKRAKDALEKIHENRALMHAVEESGFKEPWYSQAVRNNFPVKIHDLRDGTVYTVSPEEARHMEEEDIGVIMDE